MSKKLGKILVGILIAACGVCIGGQACGLLPGGLSMDGWWTVFLIVPGVLLLACVGLNAFDALLTGLGVLFLLDEQGALGGSLGYRLAIPYGLVVIGLAFIFSQRKPRESVPSSRGIFAGSNETLCFAVGGSNSRQFRGDSFRSGLLAISVFGRSCLDLRSAQITEDSVIRLCTVFGFAEVLLPEGLRLSISSFPVFGRQINAYVPATDPNAPVITVKSVTVFGGVSIQ